MGSCLSVAGAPSDACDDRLWSPTELSDHRIEMRVHRVPGRLFLNGSSQIASLYCRKGYGGINQDAMLVWENFCSNDGTVLCGVFDGHGPYGHLVAKKLRDSFPLKLMAQWNSSNPDSTYSYRNFFNTSMNNDFEPCTIAPTEIATLRQSFIRASKIMDRDLRIHNQIDCSSSGSTAVTLLKQGHDLLIANVGDSRAVLATHDRNGSLIAIQLTTDLKPDLPREAERIRICKGRVFALQNEPGIYRLWLPNVDSPGLAMSRSFGDFCLKDFGLISVPDLSYHRLNHRDQFVVLATDGVTLTSFFLLSNTNIYDPHSCVIMHILSNLFRYVMFYQTKKLCPLCRLVHALQRLEYWLTQLFRHGKPSFPLLRLMIAL
ncbi:probable protein phosphatase 2C 33 isoform X1 [Vigna umbellata]|uniref:probable protein phosphatase 2C 33 isoform X1 n=1 Tax=Vigna umbellata TaxID=87088 RepID=UPI001F5EB381|nr:probable protein phosphatase 2C 33 isoform X1 [Vigna umbellata]